MSEFKEYIKKVTQKIVIKLKHLGGTPYSIAAGFACGVAISFTPFIGFHLILAAVTAWLLRGNVVSSAIGTLIGNPWTFPFIWIAVLMTGHFFLGQTDLSANVDFLHTFEAAGKALFTLNFSNFGRDIWPILLPMMVGCIPFYIASWLISYKLIKSTMEKITQRRARRVLEVKD